MTTQLDRKVSSGDLQQRMKELLDKATMLTVEAEQYRDPATMRWLANRLSEVQEDVKNKLQYLQGRLNSRSFGRLA